MLITAGNKKFKIMFYFLTFILLSTVNSLENYKISSNKSIFHLNKIEIIGTNKIKIDSLQSELDNELLGQNLYSLSSKSIANILNENKLIKKFNVNKQYPDKIIIKLKEVELVAILIKDKKKYFLADNNNLISYNENLVNSNLPNIYGKGAEHHFNNFKKILEENDFDIDSISSYYFFKINRWDLTINDRRTIKLPEKNLQQAIITINKLLKNKKFDKYSVIDLRINDKIITQ